MHRTGLLFSVCCLSLVAHTALGATPAEYFSAHQDEIVSLYKHFHQNPELSHVEVETARRVAEEWKKAGLEVTTGVGGHGVVGILKNGAGPTVMWRTDLDALPVEEQTQLPYASKVRGKDHKGTEWPVMHACGHDIHITNACVLAQYLAANKNLWQGTVMFIGQPAEERGAGARAMLKVGLFTRWPKPDFGLAFHVDAHLPTSKVGYRAGYAMANVDSVDITCRGRGGHGSAPHTTIDPIVQAAHLVVDLQTIVSREISAQEPAVVTVGSIHGGTKHNIIGDTCVLQITVRSYSDKVRKQLLGAIKRKALAAAASQGAPEPIVHVDETDFTPALKNDKALVERIVPVLRKTLGGEASAVEAEPTMGGEDFAEYGLAGVPIFMYRLGSVDEKRLEGYIKAERPSPSLHSPIYWPDAAAALQTGLVTSSAALFELLPKK